MDWLRAHRPDLVPRYEELYRRTAYAPRRERERLARMVRRGRSPMGFRGPREGSDLWETPEAPLEIGGREFEFRQQSLF